MRLPWSKTIFKEKPNDILDAGCPKCKHKYNFAWGEWYRFIWHTHCTYPIYSHASSEEHMHYYCRRCGYDFIDKETE